MIMAKKGKILTEEHKMKIGEANKKSQKGNKNAKGHKLSEEWKISHGKKIKEIHLKKPDTYKKQRQGAKERWMGENNPNWKGGITEENRLIRRSLQYEIWRKEVYKRDKWTCRICEKKCTSKDIIAHHLKLFSEFPELRFDIDNGLTLCRSCHAKLHKQTIIYE